jgi:3-hydroxyacyl-[acyl-carrier-protein] dehydratase
MIEGLYHIQSVQGDQFIVRLNAAHAIYQAHFPGMPVTPGVVTLQMVTELAERRANCRLRLVNGKNIKFLRVISPVDTPEILVTIQTSETDGLLKVNASVTDAENNEYARLLLIFERWK